MSISFSRVFAFVLMLAAAVLVCDRLSEARPSTSTADELLVGRFVRR